MGVNFCERAFRNVISIFKKRFTVGNVRLHIRGLLVVLQNHGLTLGECETRLCEV